jgi:glycosyltransferase involved in cell wall biosynthesis
MMSSKPIVLYLGNALSAHGKNPTAVEKLAPLLSEFCEVKTESTALNKIKRGYDFVAAILKYRKQASLTIIDTYSGSAFYFALLAGITCKIFNVPFCLALHGGDLPAFYMRNPRMVAILFNKANILIAPSPYLEAYFNNAGFSNLKMIPNSLEIDKFPFKQRSNDSNRFIWMRAFHQIYNPTMAIRVLYRLVKVDPNAQLTMIGPKLDNSLDEVKQLVEELELAAHVTFTGKVTQDEWVNLAQEQDIFINTSNKDNLPYTILEAMAPGLPIISTNVGGLSFFLEHQQNSLLCNANADEEMTQNILQLADNKKKIKQLSYNGRETAAMYSWTHIKPQWIQLINNFQND